MALYRKQAISNFLKAKDGEVLHIGKLPFRYLTIFILFFLLCLATFLLWGSYAQTEVVTGMLVPSKGETRIHSGGGGLVANLQVIEGQSVQKGDLLFTLRSVHSIGAFSDFNEAAMEQIEHLIQLQKARIVEQDKLLLLPYKIGLFKCEIFK